MGRRKIEIQPITHERNRSVTFLKRKNGLFKKAYELGVLCSVDVAVIIFEERPGHHLKLYQYCSSDIQDIVQRHIRYDGEKDTRTPGDFSGNSIGKMDEAADIDDEDVDDEDIEPASARGSASKRLAKVKSEYVGNLGGSSNPSMNVDMDYHSLHRTMAIQPPPMLSQHPNPINNDSASSIPISGERLSSSSSRVSSASHMSAPNKKIRMTPNVNINSAGRSSDDMGVGSAYGYRSSSASQPNFRQPPPQNSQYNPFYGVSPPPPGFLPNGFDYPSSSSRAPHTRNASFTPRPAPYQDQSQPVFQQGGRASSGPQHHSQSHPGQPQPPNPNGTDFFAAFLETDEQRPVSRQNRPFDSIDWPVHTGPGQHGHQHSGPGQPGVTSTDNTWLDFLSGNTAGAPQNTHLRGPSSAGGPGLESMSWERSQDVELYRGIGGVVDGPGSGRPPSSTSMTAQNSNKRSRVNSAAGSGVESGPEKEGDIGAMDGSDSARAATSSGDGDVKGEASEGGG